MLSIIRRKLITETSSEEIARVCDLLKRNKVPYDVKTVRNRGSLKSALDIRDYAKANIAYGHFDANNSFTYSDFVKDR